MSLRDDAMKLVERWRRTAANMRTLGDDGEAGIAEVCADELAALLERGVSADTNPPASVSTLETDKSLPLMARREWMADVDKFVYWSPQGDFDSYIHYRPENHSPVTGAWFRIADTDEHCLEVVPRTADMPSGAKYRWRIGPAIAWMYEHGLPARIRQSDEEWQRIEDSNPVDSNREID